MNGTSWPTVIDASWLSDARMYGRERTSSLPTFSSAWIVIEKSFSRICATRPPDAAAAAAAARARAARAEAAAPTGASATAAKAAARAVAVAQAGLLCAAVSGRRAVEQAVEDTLEVDRLGVLQFVNEDGLVGR